jgi:hypothetical protein
MKPRTTWILLALALLIGLVAWWDYKKGVPADQARQRRARLLDLKPDEVTRLEILSGEQTIVLEKADDRWFMRQPLAVRADAGAVRSILSELEFAPRRRTLTEKDLADLPLAELGLDPAPLRATIEARGKPIRLLIGAETPARDGIYVRLDDRNDVVITATSLRERLDRRIDDLRDRDVLDISVAAVTRVEIKSDERVIELVRAPGITGFDAPWTITRPLNAPADAQKANELVRNLSYLRVQQFVSENPADIHTHHLDDPQTEITVWTGAAETGKTLLLSAPSDPDLTVVYAKLKGADSIFTLPAHETAKFAFSVNDLRDRRVLVFSQPNVNGIEITRGADKIILARDHDGPDRWKITAPVAVAADEIRVNNLLNRLDELRVKEFVADVVTDLDQYGLATPAASVTLLDRDNTVIAQLMIGAVHSDQTMRLVKRASEPFVYGVEAALMEWLPNNHLHLRTRQLADITRQQFTRFKLQTPDATVALEKTADAKWRMLQPEQGVLDHDNLDAMLQVLAGLRAVEFVREGLDDLEQYGLDAPQFTATAWVGEVPYSLTLGREAEPDRVYAAWNDPPLIFTLAGFDVVALKRNLVTEPAPAPPANDEPPGQDAGND